MIEDCRVNKTEQQAEPPQEEIPVQQITYPLRDEGYSSLEELHIVFLWGDHGRNFRQSLIFLYHMYSHMNVCLNESNSMNKSNSRVLLLR